jgi:8-oxo-dGTP pyrophosphatase MutT (NUDIX family)
MEIINHKNLTPEKNWKYFRKVRAVIEDSNGNIAISTEGGKYIFPGGKCEQDEPEDKAISREIFEETGIKIDSSSFIREFQLYVIYDNFYNYRTGQHEPRHMLTTFYYAKTNETINEELMQLTEGELKEGFKISFVDKNSLIKMLNEDHSNMENGIFFDEENKMVINKILKK